MKISLGDSNGHCIENFRKNDSSHQISNKRFSCEKRKILSIISELSTLSLQKIQVQTVHIVEQKQNPQRESFLNGADTRTYVQMKTVALIQKKIEEYH